MRGLFDECWGTNFRALILLAHSQNTYMSPYIILGPHKYFSHIIQIFFMILGSHQFFLYKTHINISHIYYPNILHVIGPSQMLLTQAHKLPWALSQILSIIAHILSNLGFHKNTTKIGPQNYIFPTQSPTLSGLWAKPKESPKFQSLITMWLIPKFYYDVANSKAHYDAALFHKSKARYDAALFTKPVTTWHL